MRQVECDAFARYDGVFTSPTIYQYAPPRFVTPEEQEERENAAADRRERARDARDAVERDRAFHRRIADFDADVASTLASSKAQ